MTTKNKVARPLSEKVRITLDEILKFCVRAYAYVFPTYVIDVLRIS